MQKALQGSLILCIILGMLATIMFLVHNEKLNLDYLSKTRFMANETESISKDLKKHLDKLLEEGVDWLRGEHHNNTLEPCPDHPPKLIGPFSVEFSHNRSWNEVRRKTSSFLRDGGGHKPGDCVSKHKVRG